MKRYRLKIPEKTLSHCAAVIAELNMYEKVDWIISYQQLNELERRYDFMVPKYWLEEIKDEPMNEVDWAISVYGNRDNIFTKCFSHEDILQAFRAGAAENEKKHRLQQTFDEWWRSNGSVNGQFAIQSEAWQAHAKATNTES